MKKLNRKVIIYVVISVVCVAVLLLTSENGQPHRETESDYEERVEQKLTELISQLGGISDVKVMVVQECGIEYIYAVDKESTSESEQTEYYSAGNEEALLLKEISPVIKGVAVVCNSNKKETDKAKITELVSRVLNISTTRIFVET